MKIKFNTLVICLISFLVSACGGGGESLTLNIKDKEQTFESKTVWFSKDSHTLSNNQGKSSYTHFMIMNYERAEKDTFSSTDMLKSPEQIKIRFTLAGENGTDEKSPIKIGEYPAKKSATDHFSNVSGADIVYLEDGKEKGVYFRDNFNGKIVVNSVSDDTITGTIDLSKEDGSAIKGNFTAKHRQRM